MTNSDGQALENSFIFFIYNLESLDISVTYESIQTRSRALENRCKLYPPERQLTKANQPSLNLEGGAQDQI